MRIAFILPAIGKKPGEKYIGTWKMEPLMMAVLKSLTPPDVDTVLYDDRIELIRYDDPADLVCITVETYTAMRSYAVAARFRERGVPVVMGGYHPTLVPDEAAEHADCVVTGNAERVWTRIVSDFRSGRLQKRYDGGAGGSGFATGAFGESDGIDVPGRAPSASYGIDVPGRAPSAASGASTDSRCGERSAIVLPDRSLYADKKYLPVRLVETGRGCVHRCEFCAIAGYYGCRYHARDHAAILAELEASPRRWHFLVDDNLVADRENARRLFEKMAPLKKKWAGQGTLSMAKDADLLKKMKRSGCELILIGFESLEEESLRQMNKSWNAAAAERDELVKRIHDAGIGIYATFVFGYDGDTEETFARTLAFAERHRFYTAAFNHLLPFPGTPLHARLQAENRLLWDKWWLAEDYRYGELAFRPKNLTPERTSRLCRETRKAFARLPVVAARGLQSMAQSSPAMWMLYWAMNLRLGEEIDEKFAVPIGRNLDEWPK